jgi:hypothetical protein
MDMIPIYVLAEAEFQRGREARRNVGVTTSLADAECHRSQEPEPKGEGFVEFCFDTFMVPAGAFQSGAESTALLMAVREFRAVASPLKDYIESIGGQ